GAGPLQENPVRKVSGNDVPGARLPDDRAGHGNNERSDRNARKARAVAQRVRPSDIHADVIVQHLVPDNRLAVAVVPYAHAGLAAVNDVPQSSARSTDGVVRAADPNRGKDSGGAIRYQSGPGHIRTDVIAGQDVIV